MMMSGWYLDLIVDTILMVKRNMKQDIKPLTCQIVQHICSYCGGHTECDFAGESVVPKVYGLKIEDHIHRVRFICPRCLIDFFDKTFKKNVM